MKLQIGHTYKDREGTEITIVGETGDQTYPFKGDDCSDYTEDGAFYIDEPTEWDLIEDITPLSLKIGKEYRLRNGGTVEIKHIRQPAYPVTASNEYGEDLNYTLAGKFNLDIPNHPLDIVEEL